MVYLEGLLLKVFRKVYRKLHKGPDTHQILPQTHFDADEASRHIYSLLMSDLPCMIARFGSTELSCICNYLSIKNPVHNYWEFIKGERECWWWDSSIMNQMSQWSGFFPSDERYLSRFCERMLEDTAQLDVLGSWVSMETRLDGFIRDNVYVTPLRFLEPFWSSVPWTRALEGKRVVVVHPFADLIERQYKTCRDKLFNDKSILPDFYIRTVAAVQSLGGESNRFSDWFSALEWMEKEIAKEDFDICLIGCGAYGFPLAAFVKRLGKKAVHLGGSLQLLFGIRGSRWENPDYGVKEWGIPRGFYSSIMNEFWVRPGENHKPKNAGNVENGCYW